MPSDPAPTRVSAPAINGRFRGQVMTGVQRYATEVVAALERRCAAGTVTVLEPPAGNPLRARFWELWALSEQARVATGSPATLNLGNWGPLRGIDEATVVVHDTAPLEVPAGFSRVYRSSVWGWMKILRHSRAQVVTVSTRSRRSLEALIGRPVAVAPNGVDVPAALARQQRALPWIREQGLHERPFALLVGGHDPRKNARFALGLLPGLQQRGLDLVITHRASSRMLKIAEFGDAGSGLRPVADPTDDQLWALYGQAEVVLHPSTFEGFGLPMLEGMAVGTPFLSTEVGAAEDLAVDPRQVLPPDPAAWLEALDVLRRERPDWGALSRERAAHFSWASSAEALLQATEENRARPRRARRAQ